MVASLRFILLLGLVLAIAGCRNRNRSLDEKSFDAKALQMVQQRTGLSFPSDSRGLRMFYQGAQIDPSFVAKVEIAPSSREALTKQIEQLPNRAGVVIGSLAEKVSWWTPLQATVRLERQFTRDGNYVHVVLCDEKDRWILYLEWIKI